MTDACNIFYYPIDTWADFIMFQFCMDRGAGHQLEDVRKSTYGPWKREIERIFKEKTMHVNHSELLGKTNGAGAKQQNVKYKPVLTSCIRVP